MKIDGCHVRCITANEVEHLDFELEDGVQNNIIQLHTESTTAKAAIPVPVPGSEITHKTHIIHTRICLTQFPLNIADARTVHKLQGKSVENLLISTWDYSDNWIYVVLSRIKTSCGLFVRKALLHCKTRGMSEACKIFHE